MNYKNIGKRPFLEFARSHFWIANGPSNKGRSSDASARTRNLGEGKPILRVWTSFQAHFERLPVSCRPQDHCGHSQDPTRFGSVLTPQKPRFVAVSVGRTPCSSSLTAEFRRNGIPIDYSSFDVGSLSPPPWTAPKWCVDGERLYGLTLIGHDLLTNINGR